MTTLYVANSTRQIQEIQFRLPDKSSPMVQRVQPGAQIKIAGDLSTKDVEIILKQHVPYGWVEASAVDRTKPFIGMIYSIDKPVPYTRIVASMEHNLEVLSQRGKDNRDLAAVAMNSALEKQFAETHVAELRELDVAITEEDKLGRDSSRDLISEGRIVSHDGPPVPTKTTPRRNRKAA